MLRDHALGDGINDAAIALRAESLRPEPKRDAPFMERQLKAILTGLDVLEASSSRMEGRLDVGVIAIACALGYVDVRHPDIGWRSGRAGLSAWYGRFSSRESMTLTRP